MNVQWLCIYLYKIHVQLAWQLRNIQNMVTADLAIIIKFGFWVGDCSDDHCLLLMMRLGLLMWCHCVCHCCFGDCLELGSLIFHCSEILLCASTLLIWCVSNVLTLWEVSPFSVVFVVSTRLIFFVSTVLDFLISTVLVLLWSELGWLVRASHITVSITHIWTALQLQYTICWSTVFYC